MALEEVLSPDRRPRELHIKKKIGGGCDDLETILGKLGEALTRTQVSLLDRRHHYRRHREDCRDLQFLRPNHPA